MKRSLQIVALVLGLLAGIEPVFAEGDCGQQTNCGIHCTAGCCGHSGKMAMKSSATRMVLACKDNGYCMVSAETAPMMMPVASAAAGQLSAATVVWVQGRLAVHLQVKIQSGHGTAKRTARYILFHDFRI